MGPLETYDCIVLGAGGFGSSALYHLARRGARVLGLDAFGIAHDRGSSHGETRIIRKAYFEHPDYVPLLRRAYDLWRELEVESGQSLFHAAGLFIAGPPDGPAVAGTLQAAREHDLPLGELTADQASRRWPGYRFPAQFRVLFEADAGYLTVEACVRAHIAAALRLGAMFHEEQVKAWSTDGTTVRIQTNRATYEAARLVITAGPWANQVLAGLNLPLTVIRKPVFWYPAPTAEFDLAQGNCPFFFDMPEGQFYGFPRLDGATVKVSEHTGGQVVEEPDFVDRQAHPDDLLRLAPFVRQCLPALGEVPIRHSVCMYTRSPDGHFILDQHPEYRNVVFGAGFSGHGFKFTTVLGEVLADLALDGRTAQPIGFLSLERLSQR